MADRVKAKILVIAGPTAVGKTEIGILLAQRFNGEIISADSMQLYKGLDIGTAKPTYEEMTGIRHHLIDVLQPDVQFSAAEYAELSAKAVCDILSRGKTPILVGGTGQYISAFTDGLRYSPFNPDPELRAQLANTAQEQGIDKMHEQLRKIDPEYAASVHPNNAHRVLRAIELHMQTGLTMSQQLAASRLEPSPYDTLVFTLTFSDRELLYDNINRRVDAMQERGLVAEARMVYENRQIYKTAAQAIGYKELFAYFEGEQSLENCIIKLKQASRNYAKRQITWFKKMQNTSTVYVDKCKAADVIAAAWEGYNDK